VRARKRFGQHFLEPAWVSKLVAALDAAPTDRFIEIGPGRGAITLPLASQVASLLAIEVDRDLAAALQARMLPNVTVLTADVLDVDLGELATEIGGTSRDSREPSATLNSTAASHDDDRHKVRVVGNLPYNISSPILFRLLDAAEATGSLRDATLMLQKEVADRLAAQPGTGDYGVLTLSIALGADVSTLLALPPGAFRPPPKVRSSVVRLTFRPPPPEVHHRALILDLVRAMFTQRRKMLSNAVAPYASSRGISPRAALAAAGLDGRRRPETLTLAEVARLADEFARAS
jgi:16S rRNA (adenine1518-N6/adenine1519-N6)-dimethyltransferase